MSNEALSGLAQAVRSRKPRAPVAEVRPLSYRLAAEPRTGPGLVPIVRVAACVLACLVLLRGLVRMAEVIWLATRPVTPGPFAELEEGLQGFFVVLGLDWALYELAAGSMLLLVSLTVGRR